MRVINLLKEESSWEWFNFPDGQPHIKVAPPSGDDVTIFARITNGQDLLRVMFVNEILRSSGVERVYLSISYLMGARMDRRMPEEDDGKVNPFSLKVICDILLTGKFHTIHLFDPHSDVAPALLNARVHPATWNVGAALNALEADHRRTVLVSPDTGASKRVEYIAHALGGWDVIHAHKVRDPATGELSGTRLVAGPKAKNRHALIVDDICDGGRTFEPLADLLLADGANGVSLYVSHGVFSRGYDLRNISWIFTTDSYQPHHNAPRKVTVDNVKW